jgi:hypothetical protein
MKISVFKIRFNQSSYQLNEEYERLSDHEKENIAELDAESFFDHQDYNDRYVCYLICKPTEVKKYSQILVKNLIHHELKDLSKDILSFNINIEEELKPLLSTINSIKYSFFIDDLNEWIIQNLDIDTVLDRISVVGMDNLTEIEKKFLDNYQV